MTFDFDKLNRTNETHVMICDWIHDQSIPDYTNYDWCVKYGLIYNWLVTDKTTSDWRIIDRTIAKHCVNNDLLSKQELIYNHLHKYVIILISPGGGMHSPIWYDL